MLDGPVAIPLLHIGMACPGAELRRNLSTRLVGLLASFTHYNAAPMDKEISEALKTMTIILRQHERALRDDLHKLMAIIEVLDKQIPGLATAVESRATSLENQYGVAASNQLIDAMLDKLNATLDRH
jgi:hypothetical protein